MSDCAKEVEWSAGKHVFDLGNRTVLSVLEGRRARHYAHTKTASFQLLPLFGQFGETPAACLKRFEEGVYSIADVERVILYGLWGGGMPFSEADDLVEQHVRGKPLAPNATLAFAIITTLFVGAA